jgi:phage protein D
VVSTVAKRNNLRAQVDELPLLAGKLFQIDWAKLTDGVSDAAILHKLAELSGARWWVKNGTLYFKTKSDISSNYIVHYQAGEPSSGDFLQMGIVIFRLDAPTPLTSALICADISRG